MNCIKHTIHALTMLMITHKKVIVVTFTFYLHILLCNIAKCTTTIVHLWVRLKHDELKTCICIYNIVMCTIKKLYQCGLYLYNMNIELLCFDKRFIINNGRGKEKKTNETNWKMFSSSMLNCCSIIFNRVFDW